METSINIVESISEDLGYNNIFSIISRAYYEYNNILNFIKELTALKKLEPKKKDNKLFSEIKNTKEFRNLVTKEKYTIPIYDDWTEIGLAGD